jgi:hypothetical protein
MDPQAGGFIDTPRGADGWIAAIISFVVACFGVSGVDPRCREA